MVPRMVALDLLEEEDVHFGEPGIVGIQLGAHGDDEGAGGTRKVGLASQQAHCHVCRHHHALQVHAGDAAHILAAVLSLQLVVAPANTGE